MGALFTLLFSKIAAMMAWIGLLTVAVFVALWAVVKDGWSWPFDQMMSVSVSAVSSIDISQLSSVNAWGSLPGEVLNILGLLGVGTAVSIITAAIGVRLVLQLIPFVRLGS